MRRRCGWPRVHARWRALLRVCAAIGSFAGAVSADAAFELRPSAGAGAPVLPVSLPAGLSPLAGSALAQKSAWAAAALHLELEPAARLSLDAAGLRYSCRGWAGQISATRLGLPGYAEWEADVSLAAPLGLSAEASLYRTQPSDLLQSSAGVRPRAASGLGLSWARFLGERMTFSAWVRDAAGTGHRRQLGIAPAAGTRLAWTFCPGWTVVLVREWGSGRAQPVARAGLAWRPVTGWSLEHAIGGSRGGESTALRAEARNVEVMAWSGRLAAGLPSMAGLAVGCWREAGPAAVVGGPGGSAMPATDDSVAPSAVPVGSLPDSGSWDEWEWEPGEDRLVIDGTAAVAGYAADSLGAWTDSLEDGMEGPPEPRDVAPPSELQFATPFDSASSGRGDRRQPASWASLGAEDVPAVQGADAAAQERFLEMVRRRGPQAVARAAGESADPVLRRLLLATAPYASTRSPARSARTAGPAPRPRARWVREVRASAGRPARGADRWELHGAGAGPGLHATGRRLSGRDWRDASWTALVEQGGARASAGRGGLPLAWGTGLWLRSRTVALQTARPAAGGDGNAAVDAPGGVTGRSRDGGRGSSGRKLLIPSSAGKERFVAAELPLGSTAMRLALLRTPTRTWIAIARQDAGWGAGALVRVGGAATGLDLLASAMAAGVWHEVEAAVEDCGPVRLALRCTRAASSAAGARSWWDVQARTVIARAGLSAVSTAGADRASPDRRLRLRGTTGTPAWQASIALEAWEDGVGAAAVEPRRRGRSLQLRGVLRPLAATTVTLRASGGDGRSAREEGGARKVRETRRLRLHATAERLVPLRFERIRGGWILDAGYESRASYAVPSTASARSGRGGHWLGVAARMRAGGRGDACLGVLDVGVPRSGSVQVAPGWSGGNGFSAGRGGLWGVGRARGRLAWLRLEARGTLPLFLRHDDRRRAHPAWVFTCGVES